MAVFGPTPLTPGILSELSPVKAFKSITLFGLTPSFSLTPSSLINLGNTYQELYKYSDAIKTYEKVIEINPNYSEAYINIAKVLELDNEDEKAKKYFEKGISVNQNNANHLNDFGLFYLRQRSYDYAVKYYFL